LPDRRRVACLMTLPKEQRALLKSVGAQDSTGINRPMLLGVARAAEHWFTPSLWRRLTAEEAVGAIDTLQEMQLVLDSILSDEWEQGGHRGFLRGERRKWEDAFPRGSIETDEAKALLQRYAGQLHIT